MVRLGGEDWQSCNVVFSIRSKASAVYNPRFDQASCRHYPGQMAACASLRASSETSGLCSFILGGARALRHLRSTSPPFDRLSQPNLFFVTSLDCQESRNRVNSRDLRSLGGVEPSLLAVVRRLMGLLIPVTALISSVGCGLRGGGGLHPGPPPPPDRLLSIQRE